MISNQNVPVDTTPDTPQSTSAAARLKLKEKVDRAPKAELHIHIEGSLEPELIFSLAERNGITLPYSSVESLQAAYAFTSLQSFLDIYYAGASVLIHEEDFYDMTCAYVDQALDNGIIHSEIFFDPQTHTVRGVSMETMLAGIERGLAEGEKRGLSSRLILCFLRHLSEEDALRTFNQALPYFEQYAHRLIGIGLDSSELGHPPAKFARVFSQALGRKMRLVAHAGEEGPVSYIYEALDILRVERIDHGVRCLEDPQLVERLAQSRIALTVCPLSNLKLCVFDSLSDHNLKTLLEKGVAVTVNSDDPAYFGGHVNQNYRALIDALDLTEQQCYTLLRNSLEASFISDDKRQAMYRQLDHFWFS
ncbi:adenosine deaminase [Biostraticola tofi]|uniref:Adenine deaminase n=1 Tax=Biostraticola tofi TaxID=466109 RepID=A0A4R3Z332_9GAMM|nr:adenosine deaminase [Biostraticola tofi]TCV98304.1 adenosine deaminase [Biostraticola tofi]